MVYVCAIIQYYSVYILKYHDKNRDEIQGDWDTFAIEMACKKCPYHPEFPLTVDFPT